MSGVIKGIGKGIGKVAGLAAPFASLIPGAGPWIGAGLGAVGGLLGRPGEDPRYAAQEQLLKQGQGFGPPQTAGLNPYSQQAFGLMQNLATSGPNISQFMNPYTEDVVGGFNRDVAGARNSALTSAADMATRDRTFGGSRAGLMAATALGDVNKAGLSGLANLRFQGHQSAVQNALQQQQFGLQSANALAGAGDYARSVEQAGYDAPFNRFQAMSGVTAQQLAAGQGYQPRPSALQSALGGAITGFGLFKKKPQVQGGPGLSNWLTGGVPDMAPTGPTGIGGGFRGYP